jgi:DNA mismatch repair protein MutS
MKSRLNGLFGNKYFVFELEDWAFSENTSKEKLLKQFEVRSLKGFGVDHLKDACVAAGAVLCYLELTHHHNTGHITSIRRIEEDRFVRLDKFTVRNLELVAPMNEGGQSLLSVLDRTLTPMGARMLRRWLLFPLRNVAAIQRRQDGVEHFFRNPDFRDICQEELARVGDMERILSKVAVGRANPRDMQQLRIALESVEVLKNACLEAEQENIRRLGEEMVYCRELKERILRTLRPDPPVMLNKGGVIASGVNPQLDELRNISSSGKDYLLQIQQRESELTGIPSLKIGFNNVFGYYIEVRNTYKENVPAEWVRKQTLAQAERTSHRN